MKNNLVIFGVLLLLVLVFSSCEKTYTPKPKSYPRVIFPTHTYQKYSSESCPFAFEYPIYAQATKDSTFFSEKIENPCWLNIEYPHFGGTIYVTYEDVHNKEQIAKLLDDAHTLTYKHSKKADAIDPIEINTKNGVHGLIYDVEGNAASSVQFYVTDMEQHYLRGALYFNVKPNVDSMAPIINFVSKDMTHMIESFEWK
jgi:gliding motility-associated lipoprotein GldD